MLTEYINPGNIISYVENVYFTDTESLFYYKFGKLYEGDNIQVTVYDLRSRPRWTYFKHFNAYVGPFNTQITVVDNETSFFDYTDHKLALYHNHQDTELILKKLGHKEDLSDYEIYLISHNKLRFDYNLPIAI